VTLRYVQLRVAEAFPAAGPPEAMDPAALAELYAYCRMRDAERARELAAAMV
jgi:hypothetical protein